MKSISFTIALFIFTFININAQSVNDILIKDIDVEYVQIVGTSKLMSNKVNIEIDFGQENKFFSTKHDTMIKDSEGKKVVFQSMIDALNFMYANGYEFKDANAFTVGSQKVFHFMLKKIKK